MPRSIFLLSALLVSLVVAGCAGAAAGPNVAARSSDVLTREQVLQASTNSVHDAVVALRGNWLQPRGLDSFQSQGRVLVYMDNVRMGGVETLRGISVVDVDHVRYINGVDASARWGLDHGHGVILVAMRR